MSLYTNKLHHNGYQSVPARVPIWAHPGTNLTASDVLGGEFSPRTSTPPLSSPAGRLLAARCWLCLAGLRRPGSHMDGGGGGGHLGPEGAGDEYWSRVASLGLPD